MNTIAAVVDVLAYEINSSGCADDKGRDIAVLSGKGVSESLSPRVGRDPAIVQERHLIDRKWRFCFQNAGFRLRLFNMTRKYPLFKV